MAIQLMQGFDITSASPIDSRFVLSKAQMLSVNDNKMPNKYFTFCSDDNKFYCYNKTNTSDPTTGKFRLIETSSNIQLIRGYYLNNKFYTDSTYTVECEKNLSFIYIDINTNSSIYTWDGTNYNKSITDASSTIAGILKLYNTSGENEDGTMTQKSITNGVKNIKFDIDESENECLVLSLPW